MNAVGEPPEEGNPAVGDAAGAAILKGVDLGLCEYTAGLFTVLMSAGEDDKGAQARFFRGLGKAVRAYEAVRAEMDL